MLKSDRRVNDWCQIHVSYNIYVFVIYLQLCHVQNYVKIKSVIKRLVC